MRSFAPLVLFLCACPMLYEPPGAAPPPLPPWPACSAYRLNLADEPEEISAFARETKHEQPELWSLRPDAAVDAEWFKAMRARGYVSFDLSALEKLPWDAIPDDVAGLSLAGQPLAPELFRFKQLRELDLSLTSATDETCAALAALSLLRRLSLQRSSVGDECLTHLAKLTQLEHLDLGFSGVSDSGVVKLAALPLLSSLSLSHTKVTERSVGALLERFAVQRLDLNETAAQAKHFARGTRFERLDLAKTQVSAKIVRLLHRHPYLKWLSLAGLAISDKELAELRRLPRLEVLDLSETAVSALAPLQALERLSTLSLAQTGALDLEAVRPMRQLRALDVSGTSVRSIEPLVEMSELRALYLAATPVQDLDRIAKMEKLRTLDLNETLASDAVAVTLPRGLRALHLRHSALSATGLRALSRLKELETLDIASTPLDRELLSAWTLPRLRALDASFTPLRGLRGSVMPQAIERLSLVGVSMPKEELPTQADLPRLKRLEL